MSTAHIVLSWGEERPGTEGRRRKKKSHLALYVDEIHGCGALVRIQNNCKAGIDSFKLNTVGMR